MGRRFTAASSDRIYVGTAAGLAGFNWTFGTVAVVINFNSFVAAGTLVATNDSVGASLDIYFAAGNGLKYFDATTDNNLLSSALFSTGVTYLVVVTKATGTATARGHLYNLTTNAWTHNNSAGTNVQAATTTSLAIGSFANASAQDAIDAEMFAIGMWQGLVMTDSEVERLARGNWENYGPDFHEEWIYGHEGPRDMMTTIGRRPVKQTARSGTTRGVIKNPAGFRFAIKRRRR